MYILCHQQYSYQKHKEENIGTIGTSSQQYFATKSNKANKKRPDSQPSEFLYVDIQSLFDNSKDRSSDAPYKKHR